MAENTGHWNLLHEKFNVLASDEMYKSHPALVMYGDQEISFTYSQVKSYVDEVEKEIRQFLQPGEKVALLLDEKPSSVIIILALLRCGMPFLPVSTDEPFENSAEFLADADVPNLIFTSRFRYVDVLSKIVEKSGKTHRPSDFDCVQICSLSKFEDLHLMHVVQRGNASASSDASRICRVGPLLRYNQSVTHLKSSSIAYLIGTSGTTGKPTLVMVPHSCIVPNIKHLGIMLRIGSKDTIFLASHFTFDASIVQMFLALSYGATLLMVSSIAKRIPKVMRNILFKKYNVTLLQVTPSFFQLLMGGTSKSIPRRCALKHLAFGGEPFPDINQLLFWVQKRSDIHIYNMYGLTEMSSWATIEVVDTSFLHQRAQEIPTILSQICKGAKSITGFPDFVPCPVPIGKQLLDTTVSVLDEDGQPVECGHGEIWLESRRRNCMVKAGNCLVKCRRIATGDIAVTLNDEIYYAGRKDSQIKRFGKRVNLEGLEQCVLMLPGISAAVFCEEVPLQGVNNGLPWKKLFLVLCVEEGKKVTPKDIYRVLPCHCRPSLIVEIPHMPMSKHGKTHRKFLAKLSTKLSQSLSGSSSRQSYYFFNLDEYLKVLRSSRSSHTAACDAVFRAEADSDAIGTSSTTSVSNHNPVSIDEFVSTPGESSSTITTSSTVSTTEGAIISVTSTQILSADLTSDVSKNIYTVSTGLETMNTDVTVDVADVKPSIVHPENSETAESHPIDCITLSDVSSILKDTGIIPMTITEANTQTNSQYSVSTSGQATKTGSSTRVVVLSEELTCLDSSQTSRLESNNPTYVESMIIRDKGNTHTGNQELVNVPVVSLDIPQSETSNASYEEHAYDAEKSSNMPQVQTTDTEYQELLNVDNVSANVTQVGTKYTAREGLFSGANASSHTSQAETSNTGYERLINIPHVSSNVQRVDTAYTNNEGLTNVGNVSLNTPLLETINTGYQELVKVTNVSSDLVELAHISNAELPNVANASLNVLQIETIRKSSKGLHNVANVSFNIQQVEPTRTTNEGSLDVANVSSNIPQIDTINAESKRFLNVGSVSSNTPRVETTYTSNRELPFVASASLNTPRMETINTGNEGLFNIPNASLNIQVEHTNIGSEGLVNLRNVMPSTPQVEVSKTNTEDLLDIANISLNIPQIDTIDTESERFLNVANASLNKPQIETIHTAVQGLVSVASVSSNAPLVQTTNTSNKDFPFVAGTSSNTPRIETINTGNEGFHKIPIVSSNIQAETTSAGCEELVDLPNVMPITPRVEAIRTNTEDLLDIANVSLNVPQIETILTRWERLINITNVLPKLPSYENAYRDNTGSSTAIDGVLFNKQQRKTTDESISGAIYNNDILSSNVRHPETSNRQSIGMVQVEYSGTFVPRPTGVSRSTLLALSRFLSAARAQNTLCKASSTVSGINSVGQSNLPSEINEDTVPTTGKEIWPSSYPVASCNDMASASLGSHTDKFKPVVSSFHDQNCNSINFGSDTKSKSVTHTCCNFIISEDGKLKSVVASNVLRSSCRFAEATNTPRNMAVTTTDTNRQDSALRTASAIGNVLGDRQLEIAVMSMPSRRDNMAYSSCTWSAPSSVASVLPITSTSCRRPNVDASKEHTEKMDVDCNTENACFETRLTSYSEDKTNLNYRVLEDLLKSFSFTYLPSICRNFFQTVDPVEIICNRCNPLEHLYKLVDSVIVKRLNSAVSGKQVMIRRANSSGREHIKLPCPIMYSNTSSDTISQLHIKIEGFESMLHINENQFIFSMETKDEKGCATRLLITNKDSSLARLAVSDNSRSFQQPMDVEEGAINRVSRTVLYEPGAVSKHGFASGNDAAEELRKYLPMPRDILSYILGTPLKTLRNCVLKRMRKETVVSVGRLIGPPFQARFGTSAGDAQSMMWDHSYHLRTNPSFTRVHDKKNSCAVVRKGSVPLLSANDEMELEKGTVVTVFDCKGIGLGLFILLQNQKVQSGNSNLMENQMVQSGTSNILESQVEESDTSSVLENQVVQSDTSSVLENQVVQSDTGSVLENQAVQSDTGSVFENQRVPSGNSNLMQDAMVQTDSNNIVEGQMVQSVTGSIVRCQMMQHDDSNTLKNQRAQSVSTQTHLLNAKMHECIKSTQQCQSQLQKGTNRITLESGKDTKGSNTSLNTIISIASGSSTLRNSGNISKNESSTNASKSTSSSDRSITVEVGSNANTSGNNTSSLRGILMKIGSNTNPFERNTIANIINADENRGNKRDSLKNKVFRPCMSCGTSLNFVPPDSLSDFTQFHTDERLKANVGLWVKYRRTVEGFRFGEIRAYLAYFWLCVLGVELPLDTDLEASHFIRSGGSSLQACYLAEEIERFVKEYSSRDISLMFLLNNICNESFGELCNYVILKVFHCRKCKADTDISKKEATVKDESVSNELKDLIDDLFNFNDNVSPADSHFESKIDDVQESDSRSCRNAVEGRSTQEESECGNSKRTCKLVTEQSPEKQKGEDDEVPVFDSSLRISCAFSNIRPKRKLLENKESQHRGGKHRRICSQSMNRKNAQKGRVSTSRLYPVSSECTSENDKQVPKKKSRINKGKVSATSSEAKAKDSPACLRQASHNSELGISRDQREPTSGQMRLRKRKVAQSSQIRRSLRNKEIVSSKESTYLQQNCHISTKTVKSGSENLPSPGKEALSSTTILKSPVRSTGKTRKLVDIKDSLLSGINRILQSSKRLSGRVKNDTVLVDVSKINVEENDPASKLATDKSIHTVSKKAKEESALEKNRSMQKAVHDQASSGSKESLGTSQRGDELTDLGKEYCSPLDKNVKTKDVVEDFSKSVIDIFRGKVDDSSVQRESSNEKTESAGEVADNVTKRVLDGAMERAGASLTGAGEDVASRVILQSVAKRMMEGMLEGVIQGAREGVSKTVLKDESGELHLEHIKTMTKKLVAGVIESVIEGTAECVAGRSSVQGTGSGVKDLTLVDEIGSKLQENKETDSSSLHTAAVGLRSVVKGGGEVGKEKGEPIQGIVHTEKKDVSKGTPGIDEKFVSVVRQEEPAPPLPEVLNTNSSSDALSPKLPTDVVGASKKVDGTISKPQEPWQGMNEPSTGDKGLERVESGTDVEHVSKALSASSHCSSPSSRAVNQQKSGGRDIVDNKGGQNQCQGSMHEETNKNQLKADKMNQNDDRAHNVSTGHFSNDVDSIVTDAEEDQGMHIQEGLKEGSGEVVDDPCSGIGINTPDKSTTRRGRDVSVADTDQSLNMGSAAAPCEPGASTDSPDQLLNNSAKAEMLPVPSYERKMEANLRQTSNDTVGACTESAPLDVTEPSLSAASRVYTELFATPQDVLGDLQKSTCFETFGDLKSVLDTVRLQVSSVAETVRSSLGSIENPMNCQAVLDIGGTSSSIGGNRDVDENKESSGHHKIEQEEVSSRKRPVVDQQKIHNIRQKLSVRLGDSFASRLQKSTKGAKTESGTKDPADTKEKVDVRSDAEAQIVKETIVYEVRDKPEEDGRAPQKRIRIEDPEDMNESKVRACDAEVQISTEKVVGVLTDQPAKADTDNDNAAKGTGQTSSLIQLQMARLREQILLRKSTLNLPPKPLHTRRMSQEETKKSQEETKKSQTSVKSKEACKVVMRDSFDLANPEKKEKLLEELNLGNVLLHDVLTCQCKWKQEINALNLGRLCKEDRKKVADLAKKQRQSKCKTKSSLKRPQARSRNQPQIADKEVETILLSDSDDEAQDENFGTQVISIDDEHTQASSDLEDFLDRLRHSATTTESPMAQTTTVTNSEVVCWCATSRRRPKRCIKCINERQACSLVNRSIGSNSFRNADCTLSVSWYTNLSKCIDATALCVCNGDTSHSNGTVFIGSHAHVMMAVDAEQGTVKWQTRLPNRIESSAAMSHDGQYVIVGCYDGRVYVLDRYTGSEYWSYQTGDTVKCSPLVDHKTGYVFVGSHDGYAYALNIIEKRLVWSFFLGNGSCFASPVISLDGTQVYFGTLAGQCWALCPHTGVVKWNYICAKPIFSSPLVVSRGVVFASVDGKVFMLDNLGRLQWSYKTCGYLFSSPSLVQSSHIVLFESAEGAPVSKRKKFDITIELSSKADKSSADHVASDYSRVSSGEELISIGCHDGYVYLLDCQGGLLWKCPLDSPVYSTPCLFYLKSTESEAGTPHLLCISSKGMVLVIDVDRGVSKASYELPGEVFSSPVYFGERFYIGCRDDNLYCLQLTST